MATLELIGIDKVYDNGFRAVHDLDLEVEEGEFLVLVGPSGCGKSTALRMMAGLESITSGEMRIGGTVVNDVPPKDRDVAMVFQNYALYPHMTVARNIGFALKLGRVPKTEIDARGATVGCAARAHPAPRPQARLAVGRPATASGDGQGDRATTVGVPHGRTAVEPRREAARANARRDLRTAT